MTALRSFLRLRFLRLRRISKAMKACFGRCFPHAQFQLQAGHTQVHGPRLQGEAESPKVSPKALQHVLDVASGTRSLSCSSVMQRHMEPHNRAKRCLRRRIRRLESMFWTSLLARGASAAARPHRGTWTNITRRSEVSEGVSEGLKACFGRCFWHAQLQLQLGHTEAHGPRLQGEAKSPKAYPKV